MLKSLEDYLTGLSFELPEQPPGPQKLDAGERAFVEKYLGADTFEKMAVQNPEPVPLPALQPKPAEIAAPVLQDLRPELIVAAPTLQIAPEAKAEPTIVVTPEARMTPEIIVAPVAERVAIVTPPEPAAAIANLAVQTKSAEEAQAVAAEPAQTIVETEVTEQSLTETTVVQAAEASAVSVVTETVASEVTQREEQIPLAEAALAEAVEVNQREKLRQAEEIQVVSFFVSGQLFLLPVIGIQEVLRYVELVKVPQAPEFVAGAINLRGTVMPLVHLSALLTNDKAWTYDEHSFIIVTGDPDMQMGLIIDKVSSMHLIPQCKIIWNVESKLGEAGEFLNALVDLDDRVCGMIAPEIIRQKLFSEF